MTSTLATAQNTSSEVLDSVTSAVSAGLDLVGDVVPDLADVVESAVDAVAATSKVAVQLASKVLRFVTRHPREVVTGLVLVAVVLGALGAVKRRSAGSAAATTAATG